VTPPRAGLDADAVVVAAARIANAEGYAELTLKRLAAELGVRSPSLYNHVDGLPGVLRELRVRGLTELAAELAEVVAGRTGDDALRAFCLAYRRFAADQPGVYAAIQPSVHTPETDPRSLAAGEALLDVFSDLLAAYGLAGDDALHAVRALRSAIHGFVLLEQTGAFGMSIAVDESFDRMVEMLAGGLGSAVPEPR
jgi:AcrR family transcriptional regulator